MPNNDYFTQYESPNIVIVPTVSFSNLPVPPGTKNIADRIASNCTNCEQKTIEKDNICEPTPSGSNCQQNLKVLDSNTSTSTSKLSDKLRNSPSIKQDTISNETPQNIKEPSSFKYKSRNNLVDLTGFNVLKRDNMSSVTKHKVLKQVDRKIEQNDIKSKSEKQHRAYTNSDISKTVKILNKESSTSVKRLSHHSEENLDGHAKDKPKESPVDKEDKMKEYFRQLWKRNYNNYQKDIKAIKHSSRMKQESKDSKPETRRSKSNFDHVSKSNTAIDLRNKLLLNSKKYRDLERRFIAKYSTRSKSETRTRHLAESNESISDGKYDLSPVSRKRYKDFQRFINLDDHENKYKSGNQNKSENSADKKMIRLKSCETTTEKRVIKKNENNNENSAHKKMIRMRSCETTTDKRDIKKTGNKTENSTHKKMIRIRSCETTTDKRNININENKTENSAHKKMIHMKSCETTTDKQDIKKKKDDYKQTVKSERHSKVSAKQTIMERVNTHINKERAKDQTNQKVKLVKNVVQFDKNLPNNLSQSKCAKGVQDLRSRLSRKRSKSGCFAHALLENKLKRENLVITVKQDVKTDSNNLASLAPNLNKPKPKKCKRIKLIINIECSNSDSYDSDENFNECCPSPEDLSFLDDFNVDEIVDSLNNSQVERNNLITTDKKSANNENDNDAKHKRLEETKPKDDLINAIDMKATQIIKEDGRLHKGQVIEINSDTEDEDLNLEIGSVANPKICKDDQKMKTNSKIEINTKQEVNNKTENEDIMDLCDDSNGSVVEVIDITDENKHNTNSKHSLLARNVILAKSNKGVSNVDQIFKLLHKSIKPTAKRKQGLANTNKNTHNTVNTSYGKVKTVLIRKYENKTSPVTAFENEVKQKIEPSDMKDQKQTQLQEPEDLIEASLETMFHHNKQNKSVNNTGVKSDMTKQLNTKNIKEENESENTEDTVEASLKMIFHNIEQNGNIRKHIQPVDTVNFSLETICNNTKQQDTSINMEIKQSSLSRQHIVKETTQENIDVPLENMSNMVDQKALNKLANEPSNVINKDINIKPDRSQKNVNEILTETNKNSIKQKDNIKINAEASNVSNIKENRLQKSGSISKTPLVEKIPLCKSDITENNLRKLETRPPSKYIQEKMDKRPLGSENSTKKTITLNSCIENCMATHEKDIRPQSRLTQNGKAKRDPLKKCEEKNLKNQKPNKPQNPKNQKLENKYNKSLETEYIQNKANNNKVTDKTINTIETKTNNVKPSSPLKNEMEQKLDGLSDSKTQENAKTILKNFLTSQIDINPQSKPLQKSVEKTKTSSKAIIDSDKQTSRNKSKTPLETEENILEEKAKCKRDIIPLCTHDKNVKEHLRTLEDRDKKPTDKPINTIEKTTNNENPSLPPKKYCQETEKTPDNTKSFVENSQVENDKAKRNPLKISEETLLTSKTTITDCEHKTNIISGYNMSDKNKKEKPILSLQNSEDISEKLSEKSNSEQKKDIDISVELTNPDKNIKDTAENTSMTKTETSLMVTDKQLLPTSARSNVENQAKSQLKTNDDLLKTKDSNIDETNKDNESGIRCEMATNSAVKQVVSNKSIVTLTNKDGTKINEMTPFLTTLQATISRYLHTKLTASSIIRNGYFSSIYKFNDKTGIPYAVKVVRFYSTGAFIEDMLFQLQQNRPRQDSCLLHLMGAFDIYGKKCLLIEYYPKNLEQALNENKRSFHIDQVQILSMQLVDAVNMLTNANIIHLDIKPSHILLNKAHDRLKLCGFDRSNYSYCAKILPNTGTLSYRAPEVILGFSESHKIDVWSTALVMFEMATNTTLFPFYFNNAILYHQMCCFGSFDFSVVDQCRYRNSYFSGTSFIRKIGSKAESKSILIHALQRNNRLRPTLFRSYNQHWAQERTIWQITKDIDKLETLHTLLEQMLILDPRHRLPIQFVAASEFINHTSIE